MSYRSTLFGTVILALTALPAIAETIVSVQGSIDNAQPIGTLGVSGIINYGTIFDAVSWSTTRGYSDVQISYLSLTTTLDPVLSTALTAYLMTKIGPGATSADEIASTEFYP